MAYPATPIVSKQMIPSIYKDELALLNALALIESGKDHKAIGDVDHPDGPALGMFQIHQKAWDDISVLRKANNEPTYPYHDALNEAHARAYALTFIRSIIASFRQHHQNPPSIPVLYTCYSLGPSILKRIPNMTQFGIEVSPFSECSLGGTSTRTYHRVFTSLGMPYKLIARKISTGQRMQSLIFAHQESMREFGISLLW